MRTTPIIAAIAIAWAMPAFAETPAAKAPDKGAMMQHHKEMREKFKNASPEERAKMKAEHEARWKERYDKASPEERTRMDAHKKMREERRAKWEAASPEERAKMKAAWKEKHKGKLPAHTGPGSSGAPAVTPQDARKQ